MRKAQLFITVSLLIAVAFGSDPLCGQQLAAARSTLSQSGGTYIAQSGAVRYNIQYSVGQLSVIGTEVSLMLTLKQGFIQPEIGGLKRVASHEISLKVFPNPFSSSISIVLDEELSEMVTLTLSDLSGRSLQTWQFESLSIKRLDCIDLPLGSYLLQLRSKDVWASTLITRL